MKLSLCTASDSPRLIRAACAFLLAALDNGTATPLTQNQTGVILNEGERLEQDTRGEDAARANFGANPPAASPDPTQQGFGGNAPGAPGTAVAAAPMNAPAPAPAALPPAVTLVPAPPPALPGAAQPGNAMPAAPAPGVPVDTRGLPWDERVNNKERTKDAKGNWKYKKGIDRVTLVPAVEAELRQIMRIPTPAPMPSPQASGVVPPVVLSPPPAALTLVQSSPSAPLAALEPTTFETFMTWASGHMEAGRLTAAQVAQGCQMNGIPGIPALSSAPQLVPALVATLKGFLPVAVA